MEQSALFYFFPLLRFCRGLRLRRGATVAGAVVLMLFWGVTAAFAQAQGSAEGMPSPPAAGTPEKVVTLMPLGDSITAMRESYRYPLMRRLLDAGYAVAYVGSRKMPPPPRYAQMGPMAHDGYGGKTIQFLAERIRLVYPDHPADIVLLHAGHNQFADKKPIPDVVAATREIIAYLRSVNPDVTVLLAQVITSGKLPKYAYIPELNAELARLAAQMDNPRQRVIAVDMAEGWDWRVDTVEDKVHPSPQGAEKMADKWYEALVTVLPLRAEK